MKQSFLMLAAVLVISSFSLTSCNKADEEITPINEISDITIQTDKAAEIMAFAVAYNENAESITIASQGYTNSQLTETQDRLKVSSISEFQSIMNTNFGISKTAWSELNNYRSEILSHDENDKIIGAVAKEQLKELVTYETLDITHLNFNSGTKFTAETPCVNTAVKRMREAITLAIATDAGIIKATIRYLDLLKKMSVEDC